MDDRVLLIDDDQNDAALIQALTKAGLSVDLAADGFLAIEKLRDRKYAAVILDPLIRHGLNGFGVLTYIEQEKPELLERLFLLTALSVETITRTAPSVLPRLFRKPSEVTNLVSAITRRKGSSPDTRRVESHRRVLLIEDDDETAQTMSKLVEKAGYRVTMARDGREALVELSSGDYVAVLLDLVLPHVDGFALLEHIRTAKPKLLRRVIVTTAMPEKYVSTIDTSQICSILHKPVDAARLQAALDRCAPFESLEGGGYSPQLA